MFSSQGQIKAETGALDHGWPQAAAARPSVKPVVVAVAPSATPAVTVSRPLMIARRERGTVSAIGRRLVDLVGALALLVFVLPLMLAISLAVMLQDGGAPLFSHARIGKGGREFRCFKFRSMVMDAEYRLATLLARDPDARIEWELDHKLRVDPRITPLGLFLRKTSLDELPQLFNVLRGDMSLVGPRPIVQAEMARYGHRFSSYCSVRPGLTGLWQVSGRNDTTYRRRVALDVLYAKKGGFLLYLWVLLATVPAVLLRRGAS